MVYGSEGDDTGIGTGTGTGDGDGDVTIGGVCGVVWSDSGGVIENCIGCLNGSNISRTDKSSSAVVSIKS